MILWLSWKVGEAGKRRGPFWPPALIYHEAVMQSLQLFQGRLVPDLLQDPAAWGLMSGILSTLTPALPLQPPTLGQLEIGSIQRLFLSNGEEPPLLITALSCGGEEGDDFPLIPSSGSMVADMLETLQTCGYSDPYRMISSLPLPVLNGVVQRMNARDPEKLKARKAERAIRAAEKDSEYLRTHLRKEVADFIRDDEITAMLLGETNA